MILPHAAKPVCHVLVTDLDRALTFYRDTLGLPVHEADDHGVSLDLGSALLRVTPIPGHAASPHPVMGWDVPDIRTTMAALKDAGVACIVYDGFGQDELGIWTSPDGVTSVAWFADPDGNVLSLSQG